MKRWAANLSISLLLVATVSRANIIGGSIEKIPALADITAEDNNYLNPAKALRWVEGCLDEDDLCICNGYYAESENTIKHPKAASAMDSAIEVTATQPAFFKQTGESLLRGDVVLKQPGRGLFANSIEFFRDRDSGKILRATLFGNARLAEYGKLLISQKSSLDFVHGKYHVTNGIYRMRADTSSGLEDVWGTARELVSEKSGELRGKKATYSTCQPDRPFWHIRSNRLTLDRNKSRGTATNVVFYVKNIPMFYTPYFSFPLDRKRKSGFLAPTHAYSQNSGFNIDLPYYFNSAPNYDLIFTPELFTKRGLLTKGKFRYLTKQNSGHVQASYAPQDHVFRDFRNATTYSADKQALRLLKNSKDYRGSIDLKNRSIFGDHWTAGIDIKYVTDDYFIQDFPAVLCTTDRDQLLNQADLAYAGERWNFLGKLQLFQTLHTITQSGSQDQYRRLPQLNLSGDFPQFWRGVDYRVDSEVVNFSHAEDYYGSTSNLVNGSRFQITQAIGLPINRMGGAITPRVELRGVGYNIHDNGSTIIKAHPIFSLDNNHVFSRNINFFGNSYRQTLEPRLLYLFSPYRNQSEAPNFDTYLPTFDFNQLFRSNRFLGGDRVGDANQITLALTSRFLNESGFEQFNVSIGQIVSFRKHRVLIKRGRQAATGIFNPDPLENGYLSPLVEQIQYNASNKISGSLNIAWDPSYHRLNSSTFNLQYREDSGCILNLWYNYAFNGDQLSQGQAINLSRIGMSFYWKVWRNWSLVSSVTYNASYNRSQNYFGGLEYNSCCWGMRLAYGRNFIGIGSDKQKSYDTRCYIQIIFKGFSDVGFGSINNVLSSQISGFKDNFSKR